MINNLEKINSFLKDLEEKYLLSIRTGASFKDRKEIINLMEYWSYLKTKLMNGKLPPPDLKFEASETTRRCEGLLFQIEMVVDKFIHR